MVREQTLVFLYPWCRTLEANARALLADLVGQVMMAHERCGEEDAEAILSNLKMEGRILAQWGPMQSTSINHYHYFSIMQHLKHHESPI